MKTTICFVTLCTVIVSCQLKHEEVSLQKNWKMKFLPTSGQCK
jgi:hypothetical protein